MRMRKITTACPAHVHVAWIQPNMAMEYSDDDSDEDFQFDASAAPRFVVPSYYQELYSSHSLAQGAENDDDGWNSDDETCLPVLPEQGGMEKSCSTHVCVIHNMG